MESDKGERIGIQSMVGYRKMARGEKKEAEGKTDMNTKLQPAKSRIYGLLQTREIGDTINVLSVSLEQIKPQKYD